MCRRRRSRAKAVWKVRWRDSCRRQSGAPPHRILRELEARRGVIGDFELNAAFRFGGVPFEIAEGGLKLFAHEVLPVLKTWQAENAARAAE